MAYNQSAYQPSQRPYYNQQAPQSPAYDPQYNQYDQYDQSQNYGYGGQWEGHPSAQYDGAYGNAGQPREHQGGPGAYEGWENDGWHASAHNQGEYTMNYDRATPHNHQGYAHNHGYSAPRGGFQNSHGMGRPRGPDIPGPARDRPQVRAQTNIQAHDRAGGGEQHGSQQRDNGPVPFKESQSSSQPRVKPAKERILQREESPVTLSFDNPFPIFPIKPKPKDKSKPASPASTANDHGMASMSIKSGRSSDEPPRPPTSASSTRSKASQASSSAPRRSESRERSAHPGREQRPRPPGQDRYGAAESHRAAPMGYANDGTRRPPQSPPRQRAHPQLPPPVRSNTAVPRGNGPYGAPSTMSDDPTQYPPQRAMTMPQTIANNVHANNAQQLDTQWIEPGPVAGYHGPVSPTYIPPRPPTASSTPSGRNGVPRQAEHQQQPGGAPELDSLPLPQKQHLKHESLGELYDQYYDSPRKPSDSQGSVSVGAAVQDDMPTDMPNFDAQPAVGRMHRRGDSFEGHLDVSAENTVQSQNFDGQGYRPPNPEFARRQPQPGFQKSNQNAQNGMDGFVFEMPGDIPETPPLPNGIAISSQPNAAYDYPPATGMPPSNMHRRMPMPPNRMHNAQQPPQPQGYPGPNHQFHRPRPGQPPMQRNFSLQNRWPEQGAGRGGHGPNMQRGPGRRPPMGGPMAGMAPAQQGPGIPPSGRSNPDTLPQHPTPVRPGLIDPPTNQPPHPTPIRPGLMDQSLMNQSAKPPPVRQYNNSNTSPTSAAPPSVSAAPRAERRASVSVTLEELDELRRKMKASPHDYRSHLRLAKKLVEAASVLADEGGRADARTRTKNREKYIFEAHKIVKKLVNNGYTDAMFYLADCYGQGLLGLEVDTKEAFSLYQAAAKAGHPASAYRTAVCCEMGAEEGGGTRRDPLKAVQWYKRAAALGDTPAMYKMGMILLKGLLGQPRNIGEALNWLKRAAETADEENPHALHELGLLYENPPNTDKIIRDEAYALKLFQQAADLGYKFSQFRLGQAYEYGNLGCPIDARSSIAWYTRAAAQGEHQSELALSGWYLTGSQGILDQSDTEAYLWARKAACADPPLPKAMFAMGYFTEVGIGCPRSLEEAKRWYGRAASHRFPKAQERLEELKRGGVKVQKNRERLSRSNQKQHEENCRVM